MTEEITMSSKAAFSVLSGATDTATLFDFDGVIVLAGGLAEKSAGYVTHARNLSAVVLSAPTKNNLGTAAALLEQPISVPVLINTKPFKSTPKPGSSGELVKLINEANARLTHIPTPLFSPKYQPYIIYQSAHKGVLSFYVLAGDTKDGEAITKALVSGKEGDVEKAAAEHGTVGVLLWRPAIGSQPAVRVLVSGTCSLARIQESLDKAARSLPFLNAPVVSSKDALSSIPAPSLPRVSVTGGKPLARPVRGPPAFSTASRAAAKTRPTSSTAPVVRKPAVPTTTRAIATRPGSATGLRKPAVKLEVPAKKPIKKSAPPPVTVPPPAVPEKKAPIVVIDLNSTVEDQSEASIVIISPTPTPEPESESVEHPVQEQIDEKQPGSPASSDVSIEQPTPDDSDDGMATAVEPEVSTVVGEVSQLATFFKELALDKATAEYVSNLSNQVIEGAALPFASLLDDAIIEPTSNTPSKHETTDQVIDEILAACVQESEKMDETHQHAESLYMPVGVGSAVPKTVKFARPYYFDVVTAPRRTMSAAALGEFVGKVRTRTLILPSKDICGEQLNAILAAKQTWADSAHPCTVLPTHSSPVLLDFCQNHEEQSTAAFLSWASPIDKQRMTVSSPAGDVEYELAKVSLE